MMQDCMLPPVRDKLGCPHTPLVFNIILAVLDSAITQEKKLKECSIDIDKFELLFYLHNTPLNEMLIY